MNTVNVIVDKTMRLGEIMENVNPVSYGLKANFNERECAFSGEMTDEAFNSMFGMIRACTLTMLYDVYKNGERVW